MSDVSRLSLFTRNHADHEPQWTVQGPRNDSLLCILCIVEMLEDSEELVVRKKFVLGELLQMIGSGVLLDMLSDNQRLTWHVVETLHELLGTHSEENTLTDVIIELLVQLCCQLQCEELVCCLLNHISQQVSGSQHFLPSLTLLGQLVSNIPAIGDIVLQTQGPLLSSMITCLDRPDEKTNTTVIYTLLRILSDTENRIPTHHYGQMANKVMVLLTATHSKELQQNSLDLLRKLIENEDVLRGVMQHGNKSSLPSILKKMLLSRDVGLQSSSMQCIHQILQQDIVHYYHDLLDADIAEFLFEALSTTDGTLLRNCFGCLLLFTDCQTFFTKCHTVYGIESIVRALHHCVKLNNIEALKHGLFVITEILKRQPEDIHLLNGLGIHKQIESLLKTCVKHSDATVQIRAGHAISYYLSKHHLPNPMDHVSLIDLLQEIQDCLDKLPRPLSKPMSRHRRGNNDRAAYSKEEELLLVGFQVFEKAFSLVSDVKNDMDSDSAAPSSINKGNSVPNMDAKTQENLQYFLLKVLDRTCIPIFMVNYVDLCGAEGPTRFFRMLTLSFKFDMNLKEFAQKLADCCFIQLAIDVKNMIANSDLAATDVINTFLVELCMTLSDEDKDLETILQQGLPLIKGDSDDFLDIVCHQTPSITKGKDPVDTKQQAALAVLYIAFLHSDRLVSEIDLEHALDVFMSENQDFHKLPKLILRYLVFLCAVCHCANNGEIAQSQNVQKFHNFISTQDVLVIYTHHPVMLHWCCTSHTLPCSLTQSMPEMWLSHLEVPVEDSAVADADSDVKVVLDILKTNSNCLTILLDILCSSNADTSGKASRLIKLSLTQTTDHESQMMIDHLQVKLPDVIKRLFLEEKHGLQGTQCTGVLDLLCSIHMNCTAIPSMEPISAKLAYHVTNLLASKETQPELVRVALNYLTCVIGQAAEEQNDYRVALVVLSSEELLQLVEEIIQSEEHQRVCSPQMVILQGCGLSLLTQLVHVLRRNGNLKVKHQIVLDLTFALNMVQRSKTNFLRVCATQLWSALLAAEFQSPVIRLDGTRDGCRLLADEDVQLPIRSCHLRRLMISLQNNVLKGSDILCQVSASCLHDLITYAAKNSQVLGQHLVRQPWNQLLVSQCLELHDNEIMLDTLLRLAIMFAGEGAIVNQAVVDGLLESVVKYTQKRGLMVATWMQYVHFVDKLLQQPNLRITSRLRDKISEQIATLQDHDEGNGAILLSLHGVALVMPSYDRSMADTRTIAEKIHAQLTSTS